MSVICVVTLEDTITQSVKKCIDKRSCAVDAEPDAERDAGYKNVKKSVDKKSVDKKSVGKKSVDKKAQESWSEAFKDSF